MDNRENILDELTNFEKRRPKEIPQILEDYLLRIAKTGDTMFPWNKLKPLFMFKMENVMTEFYESCPIDDIVHCPNVERFKYDVMKEKLLEAIDNFSSAPFTIQRLCELVTAPRKHYKHTDKFMRGLEKNVLVVSTVEPGCSHIFACDCARKRSQTAMINGVTDMNGVDSHTDDSSLSSGDVESKLITPSSPNENASNASPSTEVTNADSTADNRLNGAEESDSSAILTNDSDETQKEKEEKTESENETDPDTHQQSFGSDETVTTSDQNFTDDKESIEPISPTNADIASTTTNVTSPPVAQENESNEEEAAAETSSVKSPAEEEADSSSKEEEENDRSRTISEQDDEDNRDGNPSPPTQTDAAFTESEHMTTDENKDMDETKENKSFGDRIPDVTDSDLNSGSIGTAVGDEDDDDDFNNEDDEMSVGISRADRDEAADIDDNTMDVPTSGEDGNDFSPPSSSTTTSSAAVAESISEEAAVGTSDETMTSVQTNEDDCRHTHERHIEDEPMDED